MCAGSLMEILRFTRGVASSGPGVTQTSDFCQDMIMHFPQPCGIITIEAVPLRAAQHPQSQDPSVQRRAMKLSTDGRR